MEVSPPDLTVYTHADFWKLHDTNLGFKKEVHQEGRDRVLQIHNALLSSEWDFVEYLINCLIIRDVPGWFTSPIDAEALGLKGYEEVVKEPMDLSTVLDLLTKDKKKKKSANEMVEKLKLIYHNAIAYHGKSAAVSKQAKKELQWLNRQETILKPLRLQIKANLNISLAETSLLRKIHTEDYVDFLMNSTESLTENEVVSFSPLVVKNCEKFEEEDFRSSYFNAGKETTSATRFSNTSLKVVRRALGAIIKAVEQLDSMKTTGAAMAVVVRPPGHHAGLNGFDKKACGCGFCIVNNVCAGVAYILEKNPCAKVAIVDFDVHHGNGTQEICLARFAQNDVLFCSIHLFEAFEGNPDKDFFPGSGNPLKENAGKIYNVALVPLWTKLTGKKRKLEKQLKGKHGFHEGISSIARKVKSFEPDYLIFSAGFDGAKNDEGSTFEGVAGLDLEGIDFAKATGRILKSCHERTKVISVLEGGYGRWSMQGSYDRSDLVLSYAYHLRELCRYNRTLRAKSRTPK